MKTNRQRRLTVKAINRTINQTIIVLLHPSKDIIIGESNLILSTRKKMVDSNSSNSSLNSSNNSTSKTLNNRTNKILNNSSNPKTDSLETTKEKDSNNNRIQEDSETKDSFWIFWINLTKAEAKGTKVWTSIKPLSREWSNSSRMAIQLNKISAQLSKHIPHLGYSIR